jgi:hypothetical protein
LPQLKNEIEPKVNAFFYQVELGLDKIEKTEDDYFSLLEENASSENELSIGARINYKVPSNLLSLASCALLITVEGNDWIHNSSAKSNHMFQDRFDGPFSFNSSARLNEDHYKLKDKFSQGDLSHFTNPTREVSSKMNSLDESYFCGLHSETAIFGRGVSFRNELATEMRTQTRRIG